MNQNPTYTTEVSQWLVVPNAKKVWAQLMCWPTNYCHLVSHKVRLVCRGKAGGAEKMEMRGLTFRVRKSIYKQGSLYMR